jgi:hypothetical protein
MRRTKDTLDRIAAWSVGKSGRIARNITLLSICLMLILLACTPTTTISQEDRIQTEVAESVQETQLALGEQPPATTEAPTTEPSGTITPTLTPTATESPWIEGSVERAPYDPAAGLGPPDVHDDFSGTNPEFELDNASGVAHGWYQNGRFNITYPTRGWWTWYSGSTDLTNFYVDVVVYNGDQCVDRDAAGMLYRYQKLIDFGFLFGVTCGGGYFIGVTGGPGPAGVVCDILDPILMDPSTIDCSGMWVHPTNETIDVGPGAANRIGVKALGQEITFYINGRAVDSMNLNPAFTISGNFALYLGAGQRDDASVSFDDLSIWFNP